MSSKESNSNESGSKVFEGSGVGSENARDKRRIRELEEEVKVHKKVKTSVIAVAQEYTCPITHELMVDPVMAKDGHLYEREAIEETIRVQGDELKSPKTGLEMEPELLPAVSVKNTIEALVESGAIDGDLDDHYRQSKLVFEVKNKANGGDIESILSLVEWYRNGTNGLPKDKNYAQKWVNKAAIVRMVRDTTAAAEDGDPKAMFSLAEWYARGDYGFMYNEEMEAFWLEMAADLRHPPAMACFADIVVEGRGGVTKNLAHGTALLMEAAMLGSDYACCQIGLSYADAENALGFPLNYKAARRWLTKATDGSCAFKHAAEEYLEKAEEDLAMVVRS